MSAGGGGGGGSGEGGSGGRCVEWGNLKTGKCTGGGGGGGGGSSEKHTEQIYRRYCNVGNHNITTI